MNDADPIFRATDPSGETYDDPSEDALYMFMEDLGSPGSSFHVERLDPERQGEWTIGALNEAGLYEFVSNGHIRYVSSLSEIRRFLTGWAFD